MAKKAGEVLTSPPVRNKKLTTGDEAEQSCGQHKTPCHDCPWRRDSLNGWLGDLTPEEWIRSASNETRMECHTQLGAQCAGAAIYRRNTCKRVDPPHLVLEKNHETVFSTPMEFVAHHQSPPIPTIPTISDENRKTLDPKKPRLETARASRKNSKR